MKGTNIKINTNILEDILGVRVIEVCAHENESLKRLKEEEKTPEIEQLPPEEQTPQDDETTEDNEIVNKEESVEEIAVTE